MKKNKQGNFIEQLAKAEQFKKQGSHRPDERKFSFGNKPPTPPKTKSGAPLVKGNFNLNDKSERPDSKMSDELNQYVDSMSERALGYKK